jgi:hypothetical protein
VPANKIGRFAGGYTLGGDGNLVPVVRPAMDPINGYRPVPFRSGGSGMVSTARDYAR